MKRSVIVLTAIAISLTSSAFAAGNWENEKAKCKGNTLVVSARLMGLKKFPWEKGPSWEDACAPKKPNQKLKELGAPNTKPTKCVNVASTSMWGEWHIDNASQCLPDNSSTYWTSRKMKCENDKEVKVSARLMGIDNLQWKRYCNSKDADAELKVFGASGTPDKCVTVPGTGVYGEWYYEDPKFCGSEVHWGDIKPAGCTTPDPKDLEGIKTQHNRPADRQVYSSRLWGLKMNQDWKQECYKANGPHDWGKPDRCVIVGGGAGGVWGEWFTDNQCAKPLKWTKLRDQGCLNDQDRPEAVPPGQSFDGLRTYSARLMNIGGDWMKTCHFADHDNVAGKYFPNPNACVKADLDKELSWVTAAGFGAATAFIPGVGSAYVVAGSGAAISVGSKLAEELIFSMVDTSTGVWGVFVVEDESCK